MYFTFTVPNGDLVVYYDTCSSNDTVEVVVEDLGESFSITEGCNVAGGETAFALHAVNDGQKYDFSVVASPNSAIVFKFGPHDIIKGTSCSDPLNFAFNGAFIYLSKIGPGEKIYFNNTSDFDDGYSSYSIEACMSSLTGAYIEIFDTCGGALIANFSDGCSNLPFESLDSFGDYVFVVTSNDTTEGVLYFEIDTSCFSANTLVIVKDKGIIPMIEVRTGDWVLGANNEWVQIVTWMHRDTTAVAEFTVIIFESGNVTLSEDHFIFIESEDGNIVEIPAGKVQPGNILIGKDGERIIVENIDTIIYDDGIYAPVTSSGDIIVDGVLASCFVEVDLPRPFYKNTHQFGKIATFFSRNWPSFLISDYTPDSKEFDLTSRFFLAASPYIDSFFSLFF